MTIKVLIDKFLDINDIKNTKKGRYRSWDIVFKDFDDYLELQNKDSDFLARSLCLYLASWGMMRGSSKLLTDYNYLIHKPVIDILIENLRGLKKYPRNAEEIDLYASIVWDIIEKLKKYYENNNISATDTLITKILLGTSAATPAYDTYFKKFLKTNNITQTLSKQSLREIWEFYFQQKLDSYNYPPMKLIDMAGFQFGMSKK